MCNLPDKNQSQALSRPQPVAGNRYAQNDGGMVAVVRALNGDRVVFFYEQHPNATHEYPLEAFTREFTRQGCAMFRTYDLHVDPTELTGRLISLAELMMDVQSSNSDGRNEYLEALIYLLEVAIRELHDLLTLNELPSVKYA